MKNAIVLVTDRRGLMLTEHAAAAAVLTQKGTRNIVIFCHGFEPPQQAPLVSRAAAIGTTVAYRKLSIDVGRFTSGPDSPSSLTHVTSTALVKSHAIDQLRGEFDRVLYIDGDILLMGDIGLEQIDYREHPIAAVYDFAYVGDLDDAELFSNRCSRYSRSHHYFNSGFIAVDLERWTDDHLAQYEQAAATHAVRCDYRENCACKDQCVWNRVFENNWLRLPLEFNFQACAMFSPAWKQAKVRHYVGRQKYLPFKPWRNDELDAAMLDRARTVLDLPPIDGTPMRSVRSLNRLRHWRAIARVNAALSHIEALRVQEWQRAPVNANRNS